jgi:deazaflavin-dependent oxidoreductase (nitroreductase family)
MAEPDNRNAQIIEEFRTNGGKTFGRFANAPLLLLTTVGAKSRLRRTTPLVYLADGDRCVVFASMGGAPNNPGWYHNLVAHPRVTVEVGAEKYEADAIVATGAERDELFDRQASLRPNYAEYQAKTTRQIPVVILRRV